jgi:hypothetical protein
MTVQAVYRRTGDLTPTGNHGVTLAAIHDVDAHGPATAAQYPDGIRTLLDFAVAARNGQPPTARIRWCTHYFKIALFDAWARRNRKLLGERPLLITGERWRESPGRERRLTAWEWRDALTLQPGHAEHPAGWRLLWLRPVIAWAWHQVNAYVYACGLPFHPGYFARARHWSPCSTRTAMSGRAGRASRVAAVSSPTRATWPRRSRTTRPRWRR